MLLCFTYIDIYRSFFFYLHTISLSLCVCVCVHTYTLHKVLKYTYCTNDSL